MHAFSRVIKWMLFNTSFSKAIDTVNHKILIKKLNNISFSDNFVKLFHSYLDNRTQYIEHKEAVSKDYIISGIPQGSVLGPYLCVFS